MVLRYSCAVNDYSALQLSKLDVLGSFEKLKIAIAYKDPETGEELPSFPADHSVLERVEVVYHEMPGWNSSIAGVRQWMDLPKEARDYVEYIEKFTGVKVSLQRRANNQRNQLTAAIDQVDRHWCGPLGHDLPYGGRRHCGGDLSRHTVQMCGGLESAHLD